MILGEGVKKILTKKMFAKMCAYRGKPPRGRMIFALRLCLKSFQSSVNCYTCIFRIEAPRPSLRDSQSQIFTYNGYRPFFML